MLTKWQAQVPILTLAPSAGRSITEVNFGNVIVQFIAQVDERIVMLSGRC